MSISSLSFVGINVTLGADHKIGPFCLVGTTGEDEHSDIITTLGDRAHIRSHSIIYPGNHIGHDFSTGHQTQIRENNIIGNKVQIGTKSVIEHHINIGDDVKIHSLVFVPEYTTLGNRIFLGPGVCLTNAKYPRSRRVKESLQGPIIEDDVRIGARAVVLPGVRIGRNAIVGAGAVVTHDVEPNTVVVGCPARVIGLVSEIREPLDNLLAYGDAA